MSDHVERWITIHDAAGEAKHVPIIDGKIGGGLPPRTAEGAAKALAIMRRIHETSKSDHAKAGAKARVDALDHETGLHAWRDEHLARNTEHQPNDVAAFQRKMHAKRDEQGHVPKEGTYGRDEYARHVAAKNRVPQNHAEHVLAALRGGHVPKVGDVTEIGGKPTRFESERDGSVVAHAEGEAPQRFHNQYNAAGAPRAEKYTWAHMGPAQEKRDAPAQDAAQTGYSPDWHAFASAHPDVAADVVASTPDRALHEEMAAAHGRHKEHQRGWDELAARTPFKPVESYIADTTESRTPVQGHAYGGLVAHPTNGAQGWSVAHEESGRALGHYADEAGAKRALLAAHASGAEHGVDWSKPLGEIAGGERWKEYGGGKMQESMSRPNSWAHYADEEEGGKRDLEGAGRHVDDALTPKEDLSQLSFGDLFSRRYAAEDRGESIGENHPIAQEFKRRARVDEEQKQAKEAKESAENARVASMPPELKRLHQTGAGRTPSGHTVRVTWMTNHKDPQSDEKFGLTVDPPKGARVEPQEIHPFPVTREKAMELAEKAITEDKLPETHGTSYWNAMDAKGNLERARGPAKFDAQQKMRDAAEKMRGTPWESEFAGLVPQDVDPVAAEAKRKAEVDTHNTRIKAEADAAKPFITATDLASHYKAQGRDRYKAWDQYVKDTILLPSVRTNPVDAKEFYKAYDADSFPTLHAKHPDTVHFQKQSEERAREAAEQSASRGMGEHERSARGLSKLDPVSADTLAGNLDPDALSDSELEHAHGAISAHPPELKGGPRENAEADRQHVLGRLREEGQKRGHAWSKPAAPEVPIEDLKRRVAYSLTRDEYRRARGANDDTSRALADRAHVEAVKKAQARRAPGIHPENLK